MTVPGRFPGLNDYVEAERANRYAAAKMKRDETERVAAEAAAQKVPSFSRPVRLGFLWVEPNRRRDLDNVAFAKKFVLDGLVAAGVIAGDGPRLVAGFEDSFSIDKEDPRVEITIEEEGGRS
ncbi:hypothetical protein GMI70_02965 [Eggerthellaceae bacterium zg-893]|nr:hypothetical protein [Eggerthellaceae bacterium zg-893]